MLFKNMRIGTKLTISMVIMELLIIGVAWFGISVLEENDEAHRNMLSTEVAASSSAYEMGMHFQRARANMLLGLMATDAAGQQEHFEKMERYLGEADKCLSDLQAAVRGTDGQAAADELAGKYNIFRKNAVDAVRAKNAGEVNTAELYAVNTAKFGKISDEISDNLFQMSDMGYDKVKEHDKAITAEMERDVMTIIIIAVIMVVVSVLGGVVFVKDITGRLRAISDSANRIADGDVATEIVSTSGDELGDVAATFEIMRQRVHDIIAGIHVEADQVAANANNVSDASSSMSQGASEQAASVEELSASISQIASQTASNADNADRAKELTMDTRSKADVGNREMQEMLAAMEEINAASENISKIIKVIDEIAFQTNILALNAAVEAARAGQHGKGFAVVAEEVRNLAARSAKAASETTEMIESSMKKVEAGRGIANQTAQALSAIVEDVTSVADLVANIAKASKEQKLALEQINQGVQQVSQVVQSNSSTAEEAATASQELNRQAMLMKDSVSRFKVNNVGGGFHAASTNASQQVSGDAFVRVQPAKPGVKPKTITLTDDEGFGKY